MSRCKYPKCPKYASFNFSNLPPKFCGDHQEKGMENVKSAKKLCAAGCGTRATFGYPGDRNKKTNKYCAKDRKEGMVDLFSKMCEYPGCDNNPCFNFPGLPIKYCKEHKQIGMEDVKHIKCKYCNTRPNFNLEGLYPEYCKTHKEDDMIDVTINRCKQCDKRACFNFEGLVAEYCQDHMEKNMINLTKKKCKICEKIPLFNFKGLKPEYCDDHKTEDMKNVSKNLCKFKDCEITAGFNFIALKPIYCDEHKEKGMVKVYKKCCEHTGCPLGAGYGIPGEKLRFCSKHKLDGMINPQRRKCLKCDTTPTFNIKGEKTPLYCSLHKTKEMVNVCEKLCLECDELSYYNFKGEPPIYCLRHKEDGMENVVINMCEKRCGVSANYGPLFGKKRHCAEHKTHNEFFKNRPRCETCSNDAYYTNDGTNYPKRCEVHQENDDVNIIEKPCKSCKLPFYLNIESEMCNDCNEFFVVKSVNKVKETEVITFLKNKGLNFESTDRIIANGCSKYRPDAVLDAIFAKIIIEIDENQHKSYSSECETSRMMQIHQDFGGIPIIFIRYNPDSYKEFEDSKSIRANRKRLQILYDVINSTLNTVKKEWSIPLSVCYLFYDGYKGEHSLNEIKYSFN